MSLFPDHHVAGLFAKAPAKSVADCLVRWGNDTKVGRGVVAEQKPAAGPREGWEFVSRRAFIPYRAFLAEVGDWTAFFDNHSREFLPQAELFVLCERLPADTCFFRCTDDQTESHFCYFHNEGSSVKERQVMVYREAGWVFSQQGTPLPFEDLAVYQRPRRRERLTRDTLVSYAKKIGLELGESMRFGPDIWLLQWRDFNKKS